MEVSMNKIRITVPLLDLSYVASLAAGAAGAAVRDATYNKIVFKKGDPDFLSWSLPCL